MIAAWTRNLPIGEMTLVQKDGALMEARFGASAPKNAEMRETPLIAQGFEQLEEYLAGRRKRFSVPLAPEGTAFQQKCWAALQQIPYGQTRSYAHQALAVGNQKACRAVGMANHRNPLPIFIPCHRVVGKNGSLVGYAGGLDIKEKLLLIEATTERKNA